MPHQQQPEACRQPQLPSRHPFPRRTPTLPSQGRVAAARRGEVRTNFAIPSRAGKYPPPLLAGGYPRAGAGAAAAAGVRSAPATPTHKRSPPVSTTLSPETQTIDTLIAMIDDAWATQEAIIRQLAPALSGGIDPGGWTARQLLSHLIGAWQRVPIHAGF
jgi:hypothetical protein